MFGRKRRAAIKAEISGLQAGLKWGRTFGINVLADSPEAAVNLATDYMQRVHACDPSGWRGRFVGAQWVGVKDLPELITVDTEVIHTVCLRFEDDPQDKFLTA